MEASKAHSGKWSREDVEPARLAHGWQALEEAFGQPGIVDGRWRTAHPEDVVAVILKADDRS